MKPTGKDLWVVIKDFGRLLVKGAKWLEKNTFVWRICFLVLIAATIISFSHSDKAQNDLNGEIKTQCVVINVLRDQFKSQNAAPQFVPDSVEPGARAYLQERLALQADIRTKTLKSLPKVSCGK